MQAFFETHEADAAVLRHDKALSKTAHRSRHLRHLPDYLRTGSDGGAGGRRAAGGGARGSKRKLRPGDDPLKVLSLCTL